MSVRKAPVSVDDIPPTWQPQPTSRMCFVCGRENPHGLHLRFYSDEAAGQIIAPVVIPAAYQGYPGIAHGGALAAILDEATGRAINLGQAEDAFWVTAKLELRYRLPTPTETPLTVVGWVVNRRSRSAEVAGELRLADGTVTVEANAVIVCPSEATLAQWGVERAFWRVEQE